MSPRLKAALVVLLFLLSGGTGLVYEVVWIRKLGLVFGSTNIALSTVLAVFFGGIALGSFLFGRAAGSGRGLLRLYGWLEIGAGVLAFLFPSLLRLADLAYGMLYRAGETAFLTSTLYRLLLAVPLIALPTTLMGGTLPVLGRYFVESRHHLGRRLGGLYAVNTLGAAAGAFVCGFYLIRHLGVDRTNYAAAAFNVALGLAALWLGRGGGAAAPEASPPPAVPSVAPEPRHSPRVLALVFTGYALCGLTGLAYEVIWARYLSLFLVSSIYATTTILTVFLLGLVAGSLLVSRFLDRGTDLLRLFGLIQGALGLAALALLPALVGLQPLASRGTDDLFLLQFLLCGALMLVPTALMGATFPIAGRIATREVGEVGRRVGALYAANTVGAIAGSALAGFVLLPALGIGGSNRLLATVNLALGAAMLLLAPTRRPLAGLACLAAAAAVIVLGGRADGGVPAARLRQMAGGSERIVAVEEGLVNTVWISEDALGRRALWTNASIMGRTPAPYRRELSAQRVQGHIPMLLHPGEPRRVLGIAFGTGQTFGAQLLHPLERLDVVDISSTLVEVSLEHFGEVQSGLATDPRVRIVIDDGRAFVDRAVETYDVVSLEMPPHEEVGIVHFYTADFYRSLRRRLAPDGLVAQWMPIYNVTPAEAASVARSLLEVFPESAMWYNASDVLLLGFAGEFRIDPAVVERRLASPAVASDLEVSYLGDGLSTLSRPECFLAGLLMGPGELEAFARDGRVYSDDHPDLEFSWTDYPVWGSERRDLLVLDNTRAIERHLAPLEARLATVRAGYLDQLRAGAWDNLGSRLAARSPERALRYHRQAIAARPGFSQAHNNLGTLLLELGRVGEAVASYREAIRLDPQYAQAHYNLGAALERQEAIPQALAAYREAIRLWEGYARAHLALGRLLAKAGETEEARRVVDELLRRLPEDRQALALRDRLMRPPP